MEKRLYIRALQCQFQFFFITIIHKSKPFSAGEVSATVSEPSSRFSWIGWTSQSQHSEPAETFPPSVFSLLWRRFPFLWSILQLAFIWCLCLTVASDLALNNLMHFQLKEWHCAPTVAQHLKNRMQLIDLKKSLSALLIILISHAFEILEKHDLLF